MWDEALYPVARWGVERAAALGVPTAPFRHFDLESLDSVLRRVGPRRRPVVVTDGVCPGCGRVAPLREYLARVEEAAGQVVIDDTQAIGLLGADPTRERPFGVGGGGTARFLAAQSGRIVMIASCAKAFGAPLAFLAARAASVQSFAARSETRLHTSPPSQAAIVAAAHALDLNMAKGDDLRQRLLDNVRFFKASAADAGLLVAPGVFPVQSLRWRGGGGAAAVSLLQRALARRGVVALAHRPRCSGHAALGFLLTARHTPGDIGEAIASLVDLLAEGKGKEGRGQYGPRSSGEKIRHSR